MAIDYTALAAEITNNPKSLAYAGKSDSEIADMLNTFGLSSETLTRTYVDMVDVAAAVVGTEVTALTQANRDLLGMILASGTRVKTGSATMRATMQGIFAGGTTSRTNLVALATRSASRGEILFGEGTTVTAWDVSKALRPGEVTAFKA